VVTLVLMFGYRDLLDEGRKVFNWSFPCRRSKLTPPPAPPSGLPSPITLWYKGNSAAFSFCCFFFFKFSKEGVLAVSFFACFSLYGESWRIKGDSFVFVCGCLSVV
jgi:hypothetical protein